MKFFLVYNNPYESCTKSLRPANTYIFEYELSLCRSIISEYRFGAAHMEIKK